MMSVMVN